MVTRLFSTDTDSGTITALETSNGQFNVIQTIPVGNSPRGAVKFTRAGRGYISNSSGDTISEIDALTCRETARIKVGIAPMGVGIIPGDRFALVSNSGSNYISVVDLNEREEIFQVSVGREPRHMDITKDGLWAFVAISGSDYISKISTKALFEVDIDDIQNEVREIAHIFVGKGACPYSVGIAPSGQLVYSANNQVPYISVINTSSNQVEAQVDVGNKGARGVAFTPDGSQALITIEDTSEIVVIDTSSQTITRRFPTGPGPRGLIVDPKSEVIYASAFTRTKKSPSSDNQLNLLSTPNTLSVIDLSTQGFTRLDQAEPRYSEISVGAGPCSVSIFEID
jgi:YVTN family beta-propeller protein